MTAKERVRTAIEHRTPDRTPANFEAIGVIQDALMKRYGFSDREQLYRKFEIDIRSVSPTYIGPPLRQYTDEEGRRVSQSYWGFYTRYYWTGKEFHGMQDEHPLDACETVEDLARYPWPQADWFDYESVKRQCDRHRGYAIIMGHEGPFQHATALRSMDKLMMDMALNPDFAHALFDRMVAFELEYYERIFEAADGQIDILRPHDDYGTQISTLFSVPMWEDYFAENTRKLASLAHRYGAFYQQHSCGAVRPIIPSLIRCGVDILEPVQKVRGLEPESLKAEFGDRLCFHGGVDTQGVLPFGSAEEVRRETRHLIDVLGAGGGYILMASQSFEPDVPIENIEALYSQR